MSKQIEVCTNVEWLCQRTDATTDGTPYTDDEMAGEHFDACLKSLEASGLFPRQINCEECNGTGEDSEGNDCEECNGTRFQDGWEITSAQGQRSLYHGWNGTHMPTFGGLGTFDEVTAAQKEALYAADAAGFDAMETLVADWRAKNPESQETK